MTVIEALEASIAMLEGIRDGKVLNAAEWTQELEVLKPVPCLR